MNGLALCAGVGGLELGIEIAFPNYRCIAAVENNPQAARRFQLRFPQAKVFCDVLGFDARPLHGIVDCVSAGFPCQPHSVAGKRKGTTDERWLWPDIARIIDECGTSLVCLENVAGLLRDADSDTPGELEEPADESFGGMGTVLRDLAQMGFVSVWGSLRAANVGAKHGRPRVFILAYQPSGRFGIDGSTQREPGYAHERNGDVALSIATKSRRAHGEERTSASGRTGIMLADPSNGQLPESGRGLERRDGLGPASPILGLSPSTGLSERRDDFGLREFPTAERTGFDIFAPGPNDPIWFDVLTAAPHLTPALSPVTASLALALQQGPLDIQAEIESGFCRLADGVARWLVERRPRLQCAGNGVVPLQAAAAFTVFGQKLGLDCITAH